MYIRTLSLSNYTLRSYLLEPSSPTVSGGGERVGMNTSAILPSNGRFRRQGHATQCDQ